MNDRLADLGEDIPDWARDDGGGNSNSIEMTGSGSVEVSDRNPFSSGNGSESWSNGNNESEKQPPAQPKHMEIFFKDVENVKEDIKAIREATTKVVEISEDAVLATTTEKETQLSNMLTPLVNSTNVRAKRAKTILAGLKEENAKLKTQEDVSAGDMRIRENLCNTLTRKFIDDMKLYQNAQQKYKSDIKKKMKRQVQIVKPDATDQEIEQVMRDEGGRDKLYRETILTGDVNDAISNAYKNVAGKYQDVLTLEQSVAELHQMFLDFAVLTEQQGELLDQIEFQVKSAADHVEQGNIEVFQSIEYQKKIRKKQCWIIVIVLIIVIIILFATGLIP